MEADLAAFGSPLCGELKRFCKRLREAYREIKEDLTPYRDDRYYRYGRERGEQGQGEPRMGASPPPGSVSPLSRNGGGGTGLGSGGDTKAGGG